MGQTNLIHLEDSHKDYFVTKVAYGGPISRAIKELYSKFDGIHKYTNTAFRKYLKSEEGKARLETQKEKIREEAKEHLYSDRPGRVAVLTEVAGRLLTKLREYTDTEVGSKEYNQVWEQTRSTLRDIRAEMEVFGETGAGLDIFSALIESMQRMKADTSALPDFVKRSFDSLDESDPPTA